MPICCTIAPGKETRHFEILFVMRGDDKCRIGNLPNEVLEKILETVFASLAILFAGYACHSYQTLRKVNTRFRALVQRLKRFLPRLHVSI